MSLTYNGVTLEVQQSTVDQRAWYSADGKDLLGTHFVIHVRAVWNPFATTNAARANATVALNDLRLTLMTPRKQLVYSIPSNGASGSSVLLRSPLWTTPTGPLYFRCDANEGPCPIACNILEFRGEQTAIVDYAIETWVNECPGMLGITSNRWEITDSIDEDYYTKRIFRGTTVFRADWLQNQTLAGLTEATNADFYRGILFPPIPPNFKRTFVNVNVSPDGLVLTYEVHDQEVAGNIDSELRSRITRVKGYYMEYVGQADPSASGFRRTVAGAQIGSRLGGPIGAVAGAALGTTLASLPSLKVRFALEVFGRRIATRADLFRALARGLLAFDFCGTTVANGLISLKSTWFNDTAFTIDLVQRYAKVECAAVFSGAAAAALNAMGILPGLNPIITSFTFPENVVGVTTWNTNDSQGPGYYSQTRAQYIATMVSAGLKAPCENPPVPSGV